jgi:hypothetical protein
MTRVWLCRNAEPAAVLAAFDNPDAAHHYERRCQELGMRVEVMGYHVHPSVEALLSASSKHALWVDEGEG